MDVNALLGIEDVTEGEMAELADRLWIVEAAMKRLYDAKIALVMELAARMPEKIMAVDGIGVLVKGYREQSRWKYKDSSMDLRHDIREAVVDRYAKNARTGEIDTGTRNLLREVIQDLWDVIPSFSTVKAPAKRFGIDIREYREVTEVPTVSIHDEYPGEPE